MKASAVFSAMQSMQASVEPYLFWCAHTDDPSVAAIVAVLEHAKSSYLAPFMELRNAIHR
jgi:hypothetical protein